MKTKAKDVKMLKVTNSLHAHLKILAAIRGTTIENLVAKELWRLAKKPMRLPRSQNAE